MITQQEARAIIEAWLKAYSAFQADITRVTPDSDGAWVVQVECGGVMWIHEVSPEGEVSAPYGLSRHGTASDTESILAASVQYIPTEGFAGTGREERGEVERHPPIVVNITSSDANSFRASTQQITADLAFAVNRAQRRNG